MKASTPLLDNPTTGWRADLPAPDCPPNESMPPVGMPPNFVSDICLELHTSRLLNCTVVVLSALGVFPCSIALITTLSTRELETEPIWFFLTLILAIGMVIGGTAFMNQGPEALPQYPNPPRDWNNHVPPYHLALRLAPKVEWPADMDVESRTGP